MIYNPKYFKAEKLLTCAGFTNTASRGWEKITDKVKFQRLHALTHHGYIDLHFDKNEEGKHRAIRASNSIKKLIKKFKKIDTWYIYIASKYFPKKLSKPILKFMLKTLP